MKTATETAAFLTVLLVSAALVLSGGWSLLQCLWVGLGLLCGLLYLAWHRFDGGRHPCFLFLAMLLLFQMGRLIGYALGVISDPFDIVVQTLIPLHVSTETNELTVFLVVLSAVCVYAVCAWNPPAVTLHPGWEQEWLPACYVLFAASFPFVLYKNYQYFMYIRGHGGYLAIFTDSQGITDSAGALVRAMSLVASNAFILIYVVERHRTRLIVVTSLYLSTSVLELAIGLRGKVFLFLLTLWFIHNLKTGKRFRFKTLAIVGVVSSVAAVAVGGIREKHAASLVGPAGFITVQGTSMGVTQIAIEYRPLFQPHASTYLLNESKLAFYPGTEFGQGQVFDNDISVFLNAAAFRKGFGTGSSYLAEAYIAGGVAAVVIASVMIGFALRGLHLLGRNFLGTVALAILLPSVIYLPRAQLLGPIASGIKSGLTFLLMLPLLWAIRFLLYDRAPDIAQLSALLRETR